MLIFCSSGTLSNFRFTELEEYCLLYLVMIVFFSVRQKDTAFFYRLSSIKKRTHLFLGQCFFPLANQIKITDCSANHQWQHSIKQIAKRFLSILIDGFKFRWRCRCSRQDCHCQKRCKKIPNVQDSLPEQMSEKLGSHCVLDEPSFSTTTKLSNLLKGIWGANGQESRYDKTESTLKSTSLFYTLPTFFAAKKSNRRRREDAQKMHVWRVTSQAMRCACGYLMAGARARWRNFQPSSVRSSVKSLDVKKALTATTPILLLIFPLQVDVVDAGAGIAHWEREGEEDHHDHGDVATR